MPLIVYDAKYTDANGAETTTICNDGTLLQMTLRGVEFLGQDYDQFYPAKKIDAHRLESFVLNNGDLCSCTLNWQVPIPILDHGTKAQGVLDLKLVLGEPTTNGGLDQEELAIALAYKDQQFKSARTFGYFEQALLDLGARLPANVELKSCFTCQYSDYSPFGNGLFGDMLCFRKHKQDYLTIKNKLDLLEFLDLHPISQEQNTQETGLCREFSKRRTGTGYRG